MAKNIQLLYWSAFLFSFRFYRVIEVLYFVQITGSYAQAMTILASGSIFKALLEVPTGIFSDRVGRKRTTILSGIMTVVQVSFYAIGQDFWYLIIGAFFGGLSGAFSSGNDEALLYDTLKKSGQEEQYYNYYSKIGSFQLIAYGVAALIGGFLASISFQLTVWLSLIPTSMALIISFFIFNPPIYKQIETNPYKHLDRSLKLFLSNPKIRLLSLSNAFSNALTESTYQFSIVFVNMLWPLWAVGLMKAGTNFANAFSYYISGKLINRFKAFNALVSQFITSRVVLILAYTFPSFISPILMTSASLIYGIGQVSQKTLLQKEFTDHQRATMGSLDSLLGSVTFAIVSILIGYSADIFDPGNILLVGEILLLPILIIYWRLFLHNKKATSTDTPFLKHIP